MRPIKKIWSHLPPILHKFVRFGLVGTFATLLHYGLYYLLQQFINVNIAYTSGYIISFIANFYLTTYFTFNSHPSWKKAGGFSGAHLVNYLLHISLLNLFLYIGIPKTLAPIPVFIIVIPINFLLLARFVFKHKKGSKAEDKAIKTDASDNHINNPNTL